MDKWKMYLLNIGGKNPTIQVISRMQDNMIMFRVVPATIFHFPKVLKIV